MPVLKNVGKISGKRLSDHRDRTEVYLYSWVINNFNKLYNSTGGWHESPVFSTGHGYEWKLNVYVAGYDETAREYIGIEATLKKKNTQHNPQFIIKCSLAGDNSKKHDTKAIIITYNSEDEYTVTFKNFILKYELFNNAQFLPDGSLDITCHIIFDKGDPNEKVATMSSDKQNQLEIFEKFFNNEQYSDFQFVVRSKQFHVHRLILAARSPVFEALFDSKMRENTEGQVYIDDVEPEVMEKLLRFCYVGEVDLKNLADQVLAAADKYRLDELKLLCENSISQNLNVANVYDTLQLADKNNANELKKRTMEFFNNNIKELSSQPDFQASIGSLPASLLTQIICNFAKTL